MAGMTPGRTGEAIGTTQAMSSEMQALACDGQNSIPALQFVRLVTVLDVPRPASGRRETAVPELRDDLRNARAVAYLRRMYAARPDDDTLQELVDAETGTGMSALRLGGRGPPRRTFKDPRQGTSSASKAWLTPVYYGSARSAVSSRYPRPQRRADGVAQAAVQPGPMPDARPQQTGQWGRPCMPANAFTAARLDASGRTSRPTRRMRSPRRYGQAHGHARARDEHAAAQRIRTNTVRRQDTARPRVRRQPTWCARQTGVMVPSSFSSSSSSRPQAQARHEVAVARMRRASSARRRGVRYPDAFIVDVDVGHVLLLCRHCAPP